MVAVADTLSALINHAVRSNLLDNFKSQSNDIVISHLQFADDTILFINSENDLILNFKHTLMAFELFLGIKINWTKTCIDEICLEGHLYSWLPYWAAKWKIFQ